MAGWRPHAACSTLRAAAYFTVVLLLQLLDLAQISCAIKYPVITTVNSPDGGKLEILDEPIPLDCHPEYRADYDGLAVRWGIGHKARSAAECCRLCKEFKPPPGSDVPHRCNIWVWCGDPSGECWTMDIHKHSTGDCWLKWQVGWDGSTDLQTTNLVVNHRGQYSDEFRAVHKTAPHSIPWTAGALPPGPPA